MKRLGVIEKSPANRLSGLCYSYGQAERFLISTDSE